MGTGGSKAETDGDGWNQEHTYDLDATLSGGSPRGSGGVATSNAVSPSGTATNAAYSTYYQSPTPTTRVAPNAPYVARRPEVEIPPKPKPDEYVPTVFTWSQGGGKQIFITGTFNNWSERIPLVRSGHDFTTILNLPTGTHQYKFIIDDRWSCASDQPTVTDNIGNINNFVVVEKRVGEDYGGLPAPSSSPPGSYGLQIPSDDFYDVDPPLLPPHLTRTILDTPANAYPDPTVLPSPQHVHLNHLFKFSKPTSGEDIQIFGHTTRFRGKYVTTVYYKPKPTPSYPA
eukprot:TRINITY_DN3464_c0_g1_i1.p1 TRINITY_DN3464_c0_g1~~TRINITY_DN3464_c0_g1_i1.p1  ORF type:complete len:286 (-),score=64.16 TRINITY_DN3464_c0_g1_i1:344-1201(-)